MNPTVRSVFMLACVPGCVIALAILGGCAGESQTVSGSQEIARPVPPPPPSAPEPPPKREEIVAEAAAPPEDPLAWAAGLADVHFDYNQSKIRKEDTADLDALAQKLKEDSKRRVLVEGHCDSRGTTHYNMTLGERRAKSVKQYLMKAGAPDSQIDVVSYGEEKPLCMKTTDNCLRDNRRAHFTAQ